MADRKWKIFETKGDPAGNDLKGSFLEETATGFEFKDSEKQTLGATPGGVMPTLPFEFHEFVFAGRNWKIKVTGLELGKEGNDAAGHWHCDGPPNEEDGTWTAQAGGGEEEAEADVASAKA